MCFKIKVILKNNRYNIFKHPVPYNRSMSEKTYNP